MPKLRLYFDQDAVNNPIVFRAAVANQIEPSILRAFIDAYGGEMMVEVEGYPNNINAFVRELEAHGVIVHGWGNERDKKGRANG